MQVQRIQNNNNYNTTFGAKLKIEGAVREDLPKEFIKELRNVAKRIGNDNDLINLKIGAKYDDTTTWSEMGHRMEATDYWRDNSVTTYINGKLKHKDITTCANYGREEDMKDLRNDILKYFYSLMGSTKS